MTENTTHDTSRLRHDVLQKIFPTSWASEYPGRPRLSRRERRNREQRRNIARKVAEVFDADTDRRRRDLAAKTRGAAVGKILSDAAKQTQAAVDASMANLAAAREREAAGRRDTLAPPEPVLHATLVSALTEVLEKVVVTTQGRTFRADGAHIMTFTDQEKFQKVTCGGHVMNVNGAAQAFADVVTAGAKEAATPATEVTDPHVSARYDAPLNAIAMSVGGTDDLYFDRDATFLLVDELRAALHEQAKNGGLA